MKPDQLKKWMKTHNKTATDVASMTNVSVTTVTRFLKGEVEQPHAIVVAAFTKLTEDNKVKV